MKKEMRKVILIIVSILFYTSLDAQVIEGVAIDKHQGDINWSKYKDKGNIAGYSN